jgi:hypothetical protein
MRIRSYLGKAGLVVVLVLLVACCASGQVTSTIQGMISDPSGAAVPGALIRATNEATGVVRKSESGPQGYYRIQDLLAGTYDLQVEFPGFKTLVREGITLTAESVLNVDLKLEVGKTTQTVDVKAEVPQVETTQSRISEVLGAVQLESLPSIGRGVTWLTTMAPGVVGIAEDSRAGMCCDALSAFGSLNVSGGAGQNDAIYYLDGVALHYGDYGSWNMAFSPNEDAVQEMRVSTNPTSVEEGITGGVQVQMVTKGGTNSFHGTGHFTDLESSFNALPYGATAVDVGTWYKRYFGGTIGGPILKDRLFFFGAYEGLRQNAPAAAGQSVVVETQAFANWVEATRPNSVAAQLLTQLPPFKYATQNIVDVNGDGIPDLGTVPMDRTSPRSGNQYNARIDYQTKSGKDRLYGTFWRTMESMPQLDVRPLLDYEQNVGATFFSGAYTHSFSANSLNQLRVSTFDQPWLWQFRQYRYNIPCVQSDDGLGFPSTFSGACSFMLEKWLDRVDDIQDTFSWDHGSQSWKFGGVFRHAPAYDTIYSYGDIPVYNFSTVIDFANDNPYEETRFVDPTTGKQRDAYITNENHMLSFYAQNSWKARPNLTLNLGLRYDFFSPLAVGVGKQSLPIYGPLFTSDQLNAQGIVALRNRQIKRAFNPDYDNLGPRISVAWDPTRSGRMAIRGGFFVLYEELDDLGQNIGGNPPNFELLSAGPQFGIPIVYGIAPAGTRDFPINPGFVGAAVDPDTESFVGTRPDLYGYAKDFNQPMLYDANAAFQRQLLPNLSVTAAYHYQRSTNSPYSFNANRFDGDAVNGTLEFLNSNYGSINMITNQGKTIYNGLMFEVSKRMSRGLQFDASYNYNNRKGYNGSTEVFHPEVDWGRNEMGTHNLKMNAVWNLPFLRSRKDILSTALGGWQMSTVMNFLSGGYFNPVSNQPYGSGGDFNADGQVGDRPDLPTVKVPKAYSKADWMKGAMSASIFPLPTTVRDGTLPDNNFNGPGYARVDLSFSKRFPIKERVAIQARVEASNALNRSNISDVVSSLTDINFAQADSFYPMRTVQLSMKVIF